MTPTARLLAESGSSTDSTQQLVTSIVAIAIFIPIFWGMRRRVRSGKLAPNARRTNHHSRTYLVVIASLNTVTTVAFIAFGVFSLVTGDWALGLSFLLLGTLIGSFSWLIFRQGSELRREGQPDRAPSEAQKHLSRPRRTVAFITGGAAGIALFTTIGSAFDHAWSAVIVGAVLGLVLWGVSWWLYRPLRIAAKAEA